VSPKVIDRPGEGSDDQEAALSGTPAYTLGMAVQPGPVIALNRRLILLVLAIICFAIDCFLAFAKVAVDANVSAGLLYLGLVFFAGAFV
jgi:hypothetical protein